VLGWMTGTAGGGMVTGVLFKSSERITPSWERVYFMRVSRARLCARRLRRRVWLRW